MQLYDERSISPKTPKLAILKSKTTPNILSRIMEQVGKFREQPRSLTSYDPAWFVMWLWHIHCFYDCEINKNQHFFKIKKDARTKNAPKMDWAVRGTLIDAKKYSFKDRNFLLGIRRVKFNNFWIRCKDNCTKWPGLLKWPVIWKSAKDFYRVFEMTE